jgi:membrane protease subunit HflK
LLEAEPPSEVVSAYRDVQSARADKEREINQAYAYRNDIVTRSEGEAMKITEDAEGFKQEVIAKATGESKRFQEVLSQYQSNKSLTRNRMYTDVIENILRKNNKIVVGGKVLQHLPVEKLMRKKDNIKDYLNEKK